MLRLAFDFIITWRETRTRPNAYLQKKNEKKYRKTIKIYLFSCFVGWKCMKKQILCKK